MHFTVAHIKMCEHFRLFKEFYEIFDFSVRIFQYHKQSLFYKTNLNILF